MTRADLKYNEKRNFIRMQVDTPAQVSIEGNNTPCDGVCNDLSGGGMLLTINKELPLNTELVVTVSSLYGHNPMLQAKCRIARIESGPNDSCLLGLEIDEILNHPEAEKELTG
ncbi:MAG: PilZ domain-containing protein [Cellvibrionaceae bacterium]|nr:PilZ domain-containing protein [Cellvibrionaceae bacterium]